jgi:4-hydroxy-tetrahydrodipicolinate reductase
MRIVIVGPGRMGRAVAGAAGEAGHTVVARIGRDELTESAARSGDVTIEFTEPGAAPENLVRLGEWGVPVVSGTTGWYDHLDEVRAAVTRGGGAMVIAPNFSIGVQLLLRLARESGRLLRNRPEFDAFLVETHHQHKKDAPSGTALALAAAFRAEGAANRPVPITSIRAGAVPGTHELHLEGAGEGVILTHVARDRVVFARGALIAAEWLVRRPADRRGVFGFEDVLFGDS